MQVYSRIICQFAWWGRSLLAPFVLPHRFVVPSSSAPHCCSGLFFARRLWIAKATNQLFAALNLGKGWMILMIELIVGCRYVGASCVACSQS